MESMNKIFFLILVIVITSCGSNDHYDIGPHETRLLVVNPSVQKIMDDMEYDIVRVVPLDLPENISTIIPKDIQIVNNRIYILDTEVNKTVFMFDMDGAFISQLGRLGHARNEYIEAPKSFSVDEKTGVAHVYERSSCRVLKFDSEGNFMTFVKLDVCVPGSLVLTESDNYICCFEDQANGGGAQLSLLDKEGGYIKSFLGAPNNSKLSLIGNPIHKDKDKISFFPFMADSVIMFSNDDVEYTIKIDFCGQFVSEETRAKSMEEGTFDPLYQHKGVQFIDQFELTDSLLHVGYAYNLRRSQFVKNLSNNKTYNTTFGPLFKGYSPVCDFFVAEDKLLYFIDEEHVDQLHLNEKDVTSSQVEIMRNSSKQAMLDIMDKKYQFPLIMMVKLK